MSYCERHDSEDVVLEIVDLAPPDKESMQDSVMGLPEEILKGMPPEIQEMINNKKEGSSSFIGRFTDED